MSVGLWVFISEEPFWSKFLNYFSSLHLDSHCSMISGHINWPFFLKKLNWTTRSKSSYNASLLPVSIQSKDRLKLVLNNPFETWLLWALCLLNQCWTFLISSYHIALRKNASPEEKKWREIWLWAYSVEQECWRGFLVLLFVCFLWGCCAGFFFVVCLFGLVWFLVFFTGGLFQFTENITILFFNIYFYCKHHYSST